ncbi:MAG TPA: asparagine synthase (glutamine-hydrolyzing) [Planctomycetes bacterium]|nr:asparagine synthase (glutamine-hydrolyzing) [Planctomycetota bacterium]HIL37347.1 asparagine synthase (glutamine-hydrolyzing) [Planctomycetota bacterium]
MCGIAGIFLGDNQGRVDSVLLERMTASMRHRGPNGSGTWSEGRFGLGHRRLSIIDLSDKGAQPMSDPAGKIWVSFNGEIYNWLAVRDELKALGHVFSSECDTEVLAAGWQEWGPDLPHKLHGMFAFAIVDLRRKSLFLVRDRLGIKPLYWAKVGADLLFASEIRALLEDPRLVAEPNPERVDAYLTLGYVPGEQTFFRGIEKLRPGHSLLIEAGQQTVQRWYDPSQIDPLQIDFESAKEQLDELLTRSIEERLMSDVPLGCFLSGGVDSSGLVAYLTKKLGQKVQTFTVGYPEDKSELGHAARVAELFGTEHHALELTHGDFFRGVDRQLEHAEEPLLESAAVALLELSHFASSHATVLLSGEGADEAFAGYPLYERNLKLDRLRQIFFPLRNSSLRSAARRVLPGERMAKYLDWLAKPTAARHQGNSCDVTPAVRGLLYGPKGDDGHWIQDHFIELFGRTRGQDLVARMQAADLETWLVDDLLLKADKMTMAASIELRVPFLDHRLVEFGLALPRSHKIRGSVGKYILKDLFSECLPKDLLFRTKQGFPVPISQWFREGLFERVQRLLTDERTTARGYVTPGYVQNALARHKSGKEDLGRRLFSLVVLELWHRRWVEGESNPAAALGE